MSTVLFAWELGANLGHVMPMAHIARAIVERGDRPVFAVRDLASAEIALKGLDVPLLQAPVWPAHRHLGIDEGQAGYLDLLVKIGFADPVKLSTMVRAWRAILDLTSPAVVLVDHSPGLLIALRGARIPAVHAGITYAMPPLDYERFPPLRGDRAPIMPEERVLAAVDKAVGDTGARRMVDLFRTDHRIVFGLPELDPYAAFRREQLHLPPERLPAYRAPPPFPKLFVYLGVDTPRLETVVQAIASLPFPVMAYLRGVPGALASFLRMRGHEVFDMPPPLHEILPAASHVLSTGGVNTCQAALAAGRPHLVVPLQTDSEWNLRSLARMEVGAALDISGDERAIARRIEAFVGAPATLQNAENQAGLVAARTQPDGREATERALASYLS